jgi:hypothetical protein
MTLIKYKKKEWVLCKPTFIEGLAFSLFPMKEIKYDVGIANVLKKTKEKTNCAFFNIWESKKGNLFFSCQETGSLKAIWKQI